MKEITKLKAEAYDLIGQIEILQGRLRQVNQKIAQFSIKPHPLKEK